MLSGPGGQLTYAQVGRRAAARRALLTAAGVSGRVPTALPTPFELVPTFIAMFENGVVPALINPAFTAPERDAIRIDCGARWSIRSREGVAILQTLDGAGAVASEVPLNSCDDSSPDEPAPAAAQSSDEALVFYTSGTTGRMKGVAHTIGSLFGNVEAVADAVGTLSTDRYLIAAPLFHSFGAAAGLLPAIFKGASVVEIERIGALGVLEQVERQRITRLLCGVSLLRQLVLLARERTLDLSSLRIVMVAGSTLPPPLALDAMKTICPGMMNFYGTSETGGVALNLQSDPGQPVGPVGRPLPGVELRVVDEHRQPLRTGKTGEVACRTQGCFREYLNLPEATRQVKDGGWYYTGDLGQLDEAGRLSLTGRKDDVIAKSGFKVYPKEVEQVLAQVPELLEFAVVGVVDERMGQRVRAVVLPHSGVEVSVRKLRAFCAERLIYYKVPDEVIAVQELPRTATGKVDLRLLRRPDWPDTPQGSVSVAPRNAGRMEP